MSPFVIAIDGPAGSGKGTLAAALARRFGLAHLDTGRLYRAVAALVLDSGADPADPAAATAAARRLDAGMLGDPRLRGEAVGSAASVVAAIPAVRAALLAFQQAFAAHPPPPAKGAVLDGRDIGTVVCPDAAVKLFVTASATERARRRVKELRQSGAPAIYQAVLQDIEERDARDSERRVAPLEAAPDAVEIDTTGLGPDAVLEQACQLVTCALAARYRGGASSYPAGPG
ncbi:MAG TPA: (d)CMP kinase [Stellaceae bacterium]|nr:(d)CMP kinase [Stellaceae bacterium]